MWQRGPLVTSPNTLQKLPPPILRIANGHAAGERQAIRQETAPRAADLPALARARS
jgi:hypothetical protein